MPPKQKHCPTNQPNNKKKYIFKNTKKKHFKKNNQNEIHVLREREREREKDGEKERKKL